MGVCLSAFLVVGFELYLGGPLSYHVMALMWGFLAFTFGCCIVKCLQIREDIIYERRLHRIVLKDPPPHVAALTKQRQSGRGRPLTRSQTRLRNATVAIPSTRVVEAEVLSSGFDHITYEPLKRVVEHAWRLLKCRVTFKVTRVNNVPGNRHPFVAHIWCSSISSDYWRAPTTSDKSYCGFSFQATGRTRERAMENVCRMYTKSQSSFRPPQAGVDDPESIQERMENYCHSHGIFFDYVRPFWGMTTFTLSVWTGCPTLWTPELVDWEEAVNVPVDTDLINWYDNGPTYRPLDEFKPHIAQAWLIIEPILSQRFGDSPITRARQMSDSPNIAQMQEEVEDNWIVSFFKHLASWTSGERFSVFQALSSLFAGVIVLLNGSGWWPTLLSALLMIPTAYSWFQKGKKFVANRAYGWIRPLLSAVLGESHASAVISILSKVGLLSLCVNFSKFRTWAVAWQHSMPDKLNVIFQICMYLGELEIPSEFIRGLGALFLKVLSAKFDFSFNEVFTRHFGAVKDKAFSIVRPASHESTKSSKGNIAMAKARQAGLEGTNEVLSSFGVRTPTVRQVNTVHKLAREISLANGIVSIVSRSWLLAEKIYSLVAPAHPMASEISLWMTDAQDWMDAIVDPNLDLARISRFESIVEQGDALLKEGTLNRKLFDGATFQSFAELLRNVKKERGRFEHLVYGSGERIAPVPVMFSGVAGVGKSTLMEYYQHAFVEALCGEYRDQFVKHVEIDSNGRIEHIEYWHTVWMWDEMFPTTEGPARSQEGKQFLKLCGTQPYVAMASEMSEKFNTKARPRVIFCGSNVTNYNAALGLTSPDAFKRRFALMVDASPKKAGVPLSSIWPGDKMPSLDDLDQHTVFKVVSMSGVTTNKTVTARELFKLIAVELEKNYRSSKAKSSDVQPGVDDLLGSVNVTQNVPIARERQGDGPLVIYDSVGEPFVLSTTSALIVDLDSYIDRGEQEEGVRYAVTFKDPLVLVRWLAANATRQNVEQVAQRLDPNTLSSVEWNQLLDYYDQLSGATKIDMSKLPWWISVPFSKLIQAEENSLILDQTLADNMSMTFMKEKLFEGFFDVKKKVTTVVDEVLRDAEKTLGEAAAKGKLDLIDLADKAARVIDPEHRTFDTNTQHPEPVPVAVPYYSGVPLLPRPVAAFEWGPDHSQIWTCREETRTPSHPFTPATILRFSTTEADVIVDPTYLQLVSLWKATRLMYPADPWEHFEVPETITGNFFLLTAYSADTWQWLKFTSVTSGSLATTIVASAYLGPMCYFGFILTLPLIYLCQAVPTFEGPRRRKALYLGLAVVTAVVAVFVWTQMQDNPAPMFITSAATSEFWVGVRLQLKSGFQNWSRVVGDLAGLGYTSDSEVKAALRARPPDQSKEAHREFFKTAILPNLDSDAQTYYKQAQSFYPKDKRTLRSVQKIGQVGRETFDVANVVSQNLFKLVDEAGHCVWALGLWDNWYVTVQHFMRSAEGDLTMTRGDRYHLEREALRMIHADDADFTFFQFNGHLNRSLAGHIPSVRKDYVSEHNRGVFLQKFAANSTAFALTPVTMSYNPGVYVTSARPEDIVPNQPYVPKDGDEVIKTRGVYDMKGRESINGECGLPYLHTENGRPRHLVALHFCQNAAFPISREWIGKYIAVPKTKSLPEVSPEVVFKVAEAGESIHVPDHPGVNYVGRLAEGNKPMLSKSKLKRSKLEGAHEDFISYEALPNMENIDYYLAKQDFTRVGVSDRTVKDLSDVAERIMEDLPPPREGMPEIASVEEAVFGTPGTNNNPMNFTSSAGRGWRLGLYGGKPTKGKLPHINNETKFISQSVYKAVKNEQARLKRAPQIYVVEDSVKDETYSVAEVAKGKVRMVCGMSMHIVIVFKMYMLTFLDALRSQHPFSYMGVGIDATGPEWSNLAIYLLAGVPYQKVRCIVLDAKAFDLSILHVVRLAVASIPKGWYRKWFGRVDPVLIRVVDAMHSVWHVLGWFVYALQGQFTGNPWTAEENSLISLLMFVVCFKQWFEDTGQTGDWWIAWKENFRAVFYGDDLLVACHGYYGFNQKVYVAYARRLFGMNYVPADKVSELTEFTSFVDSTFLKRSFFQKSPDHFVGRLPLTKCVEIALWYRSSPNKDESEATAENINASLREIFFWGRERFDYYRHLYVVHYARAFPHCSTHFVTWRELNGAYLGKF